MGEPSPDFEWDEASNVEKVARHGVTPSEAEGAILDPAAIPLDAKSTLSERRFEIVGATEAGRILVVVSTFRGGAFRVVTAYDASEHAKRRYRRRVG